MMNNGERCKNFNHGRSNVQIKYCPDCGQVMNQQAKGHCSEAVHAQKRKDRNTYCSECGKKIRS